jgi:phage portal protein BeeE
MVFGVPEAFVAIAGDADRDRDQRRLRDFGPLLTAPAAFIPRSPAAR